MTFRIPEPPSSAAGGNTPADPPPVTTDAIGDQAHPRLSASGRGGATRPASNGIPGGPVDLYLLGEIDRLVAGHHHDPHSVLGGHAGPYGVVIRALRPLAKSVTAVLPDGSRHPMPHLHQGVFSTMLPDNVTTVPDYRLEVSYDTPGGDFPAAPACSHDDPYRYLPTVGGSTCT